MKRLVSFSVATMLAMGVSAGAAYDGAAQRTNANCKANNSFSTTAQQASNANDVLKKLCEEFGLNVNLAGSNANSTLADTISAKLENFKLPSGQLLTKTNKDCPKTNTGSTTPTTPTKPTKPDTGSTTPTTPTKPDTGSTTPTTPTTPTKPDTGSTTPTTPTKPDTDNASQSAFAAQVVSLVNAERAKEGLAPLKADSKVTAAAMTRTGELKTSFSHTRPDGRSPFTALADAGVSYNGAGENIAYGQQTPEAVMNAWMNSAGHRANIMNNKYTTIGVGYTVINGTPYWTQLFTY